MGRAPCCDKANVKKGPWSPEEDAKLKDYIDKQGTGGNWISLPNKAGLKRCGKSCRLRWLNYLRPNIKHGEFTETEDSIICSLFATIGSRWSIIAGQLPGRTDNDIKNYWNTKLKKKLMNLSKPHHQVSNFLSSSPSLSPSSSSPHSHNSNMNFNYYYAPSTIPEIPFSLYNPSPSNLMTNNNNNTNTTNNNPSCYFPKQEDLLCPINPNPSFEMKESNNLLVFGREQAANVCSPSDGISSSCSKELDYNYMLINNNGSLVDETSLVDYGLEEIKQLISSSTTITNHETTNNGNYFLF